MGTEMIAFFVCGLMTGLSCALVLCVLLYALTPVSSQADKNEHQRIMSAFKVTHSWDEE